MTKHTPEPWYVIQDVLLSEADRLQLGQLWNYRSSDTEPTIPGRYNALRIAACVNFCAGLTNEELALLRSAQAMRNVIAELSHSLNRFYHDGLSEDLYDEYGNVVVVESNPLFVCPHCGREYWDLPLECTSDDCPGLENEE